MSLLQNTEAQFYVISLVLCVASYTVTEVTAAKEVVKDNIFNHINKTALLQRINMDYIDGGQEKARMKKSAAELAVAAQIPPIKMLQLLVLTFRNLFSTKPIDEDPPLKPQDAAKTIAHMMGKNLAELKWKKPKT